MELNIKQLFFILLKKLPIIMLCAILLGGVFFVHTKFFITPLYSSSALLSYQANEHRKTYQAINNSDHSVSIEIVSSFPELIKDQSCLAIVGEITGLDTVYSAGELRNMISLSSKGTENFSLTVSCPNAEHSMTLVNAFAEVISNASFIDGNIVKADETDPHRGYLTKIITAGTVTLISKATNIPLSPSSPNIPRRTIIGFIIGFALSALFFIVKDVLSSKIITEEDIETLLPDIPSLGSIPLIASNTKGSAKNA